MTAPTFEKLQPPKQGTRASVDATGRWQIPDDPIVCLLRGDGIGRDVGAASGITTCAVKVLDAAVALGSRIYHGQVESAPCVGCHGTDAKGSPLGPDLTSGKWLWGDDSLASITHTITVGVPKPKEYGAPMPPMGGAQLSPSEVSAVAAYVWALSHRGVH